MKDLTFRGGGEGEVTKNRYRGGNCLKKGGGAWTICRFKEGAWQERRGVVFEGGGYPDAHNEWRNIFHHEVSLLELKQPV